MLHFLQDMPLPQTDDSHTAHVEGVTKEDDLNSCGRRSDEASSAAQIVSEKRTLIMSEPNLPPSVASMSSTDACSSLCCNSRRVVSCVTLYRFCHEQYVSERRVGPSLRRTSMTATVSPPSPFACSYVSRKLRKPAMSRRFVSIAGEMSPTRVKALALTF